MPGTSAILTPFCKTDGLYFDGSNEPEEFKYNFDKDVKEYFEKQFDGLTISPSFDSIKDYYDANLSMMEMNKKWSIQKHKHEKKEIDDDMYRIVIDVDDVDEDIE